MEVCKNRDCPMFDFYLDESGGVALAESRKKEEKLLKKLQDKDYESDMEQMSLINNYIATVTNNNILFIKYSQACSQCVHFEKPDVYAYYLKEEARRALTGEDDVTSGE